MYQIQTKHFIISPFLQRLHHIMSVTSHTIVTPQIFAFDEPFVLKNGQILPRFD